MPAIEGVCPVIATPFTADDDVDYDSLENQIRVLAEGGCHALVMFGFASEFYKLSDAERRDLLEAVVAAGDDNDVPIWASVTDQSTPVAVEWARHCESVGADGLMLLPPYLGSPTGDQLLDHMRAVGEAVDIPIMVQYAPENSGVSIDPSTFAELAAEVPTVRSFKIECHPPGPYMTTLLEETDGEVDVLVGSGGRQLIEALDRGAVGVIPGGALHELFIAAYDAYRAGDRAEAMALHDELLPVLNHIGQAGELFVRFEKRMHARRGIIASDRVRPPTHTPDDYLVDLVDDYFEGVRGHLRDDP